MRIKAIGFSGDRFEIHAEDTNEQTICRLIVVLLDNLFPNASDQARPTSTLVLLSMLRQLATDTVLTPNGHAAQSPQNKTCDPQQSPKFVTRVNAFSKSIMKTDGANSTIPLCLHKLDRTRSNAFCPYMLSASYCRTNTAVFVRNSSIGFMQPLSVPSKVASQRLPTS